MDIPHLEDLAFNQITTELIADARMLAEQVNERRPLAADVIAKIQKNQQGHALSFQFALRMKGPLVSFETLRAGI